MARWLGPALIAIAGPALAVWTWGRWPDVLIDFGREVYAPWRIAAGEVLYRDVAWFNGPLSPHWNALWFALFGASLRTLFLVNLALLALFVALVYRLLLRLADAWTAAAGGLVLLALFGFGQLVGVGNYNFVAPYSHEATHGLLLGVASLALIGGWARTRSPYRLAGAGACAGLAMLTKPEMALAAGLACLVGVLLSGRPAPAAGGYGRALLVLGGGASCAVLLALLLLAASFGRGVALEGILAPWRGLLGGEAAALPFYREAMGLDRPAENLAAIGLWTLAWIGALAPALIAAFACRSERWRRRTPAAGLFALGVALLVAFQGQIHWRAAAKPLPVVALAAAAVALGWRRRDPERAPLLLALAVFALVLLAKMILKPRVHHYGFALALPATMLAVVALVHWIPALVGRAGGRPELARAGGLSLLAGACVAHLWITAGHHANKPVRVGSGADAFHADMRGEFVRQALAAIESSTGPEGTLLVLPEGVMLNYLARRRSPTPYINFMPPELLLFGEDAMLERFRAHPPDAIALVHKDTREYGAPLFGRDYGQKLAAWARSNYHPVRVFGDPPLEPGSNFGIAILARN